MATLQVQVKRLTPADITFGAIWISPGGGKNGDGDRPDPGQANADATIAAAVGAGIIDFDTAVLQRVILMNNWVQLIRICE